MSDYMVAARNKDGTKNIYNIANVESHDEARNYVLQETKALSAVAWELPNIEETAA